MIDEFLKVFDEGRAFDDLCRIALFDRIQLSGDLKNALDFVYERLTECGIEVRMMQFNHKGRIDGYRVPEVWEGEGRLYLKDSKLDCRIIKHSEHMDEGAYGLVNMNDGTEEEEYSDKDVEGKMVVSDGEPSRVAHLAKSHGAAGLISDWLPGICEDADAIAYKSFFEGEGSGFMVSKTTGRALRKEKNIRCFIDARKKKGAIPVVVAENGEGDEELICTAHICHPKHEANDNASGAALLMEVMRSLSGMRTKRRIKALWVPEILGTVAYLSREKGKAVAGLNLDMVGEDQFVCRSPLLMESPPFFYDSYATDLLCSIMNRIKGTTQLGSAKSLSADSSYPLYMSYLTPFSGGSDHVILNDAGIATPMLIHWPDAFYHTSKDTIDKVSREELRRVGILASEYLLTMSNSERKPSISQSRTEGKGETYERIYSQPMFTIKDKEYQWSKREFLHSSTPYLAMMLVNGERSTEDICRLMKKQKMETREIPEFLKIMEREGYLKRRA